MRIKWWYDGPVAYINLARVDLEAKERYAHMMQKREFPGTQRSTDDFYIMAGWDAECYLDHALDTMSRHGYYSASDVRELLEYALALAHLVRECGHWMQDRRAQNRGITGEATMTLPGMFGVLLKLDSKYTPVEVAAITDFALRGTRFVMGIDPDSTEYDAAITEAASILIARGRSYTEPPKPAEPKFRVGDRVRILEATGGLCGYDVGQIETVIRVDITDTRRGDTTDGRFLYSLSGDCFGVADGDNIELYVPPVKPPKPTLADVIEIARHTTVRRYDGAFSATAGYGLHPNDDVLKILQNTFDFDMLPAFIADLQRIYAAWQREQKV